MFIDDLKKYAEQHKDYADDHMLYQFMCGIKTRSFLSKDIYEVMLHLSKAACHKKSKDPKLPISTSASDETRFNIMAGLLNQSRHNAANYSVVKMVMERNKIYELDFTPEQTFNILKKCDLTLKSDTSNCLKTMLIASNKSQNLNLNQEQLVSLLKVNSIHQKEYEIINKLMDDDSISIRDRMNMFQKDMTQHKEKMQSKQAKDEFLLSLAICRFNQSCNLNLSLDNFVEIFENSSISDYRIEHLACLFYFSNPNSTTKSLLKIDQEYNFSQNHIVLKTLVGENKKEAVAVLAEKIELLKNQVSPSIKKSVMIL